MSFLTTPVGTASHLSWLQHDIADNIETNVQSVARDTHGASTQLTEAHAYQRKAGRRMFCLLLVFLLVLTVVLLAVRPSWSSSSLPCADREVSAGQVFS